jgi:hypothetical protein
MRRLIIATVLFAALLPGSDASAQGTPLPFGDRFTFFRDRPYYEPLFAEPRPARTMILIPAWSEEFPDSVQKGSRFAWQISLGDELPIMTFSNQESDGPVEKGKWGIGLWIPIAFHVIEDFKDESNPIVDTDYHFGFMTKFQWCCLGDRVRLGIRYVPWKHESTHLGDEYTIFAVQNPLFERVNVSHEDWEYGVSFEGDGLLNDDDSWVARHGGLAPRGSGGYYSDHLLGNDQATLTPSQKNFEPSFGFEYRTAEWRGRQNYVSVDVRNKLIYIYHQTPQNPEQRQLSWNIQVGRAVPPGTTGVPLKSYFVQVYRGVNPYGQLRSQKDFWSAGFGWIFGI